MASSEAQMKRIIAIVPNKIAPEVPLTMMRGVGLRVRPANRNGTMPMVHLVVVCVVVCVASLVSP